MAEAKTLGPTPADSIYARKLARFLKENPEIAQWACDKFKSEEGKRELEILTRIELA